MLIQELALQGISKRSLAHGSSRDGEEDFQKDLSLSL